MSAKKDKRNTLNTIIARYQTIPARCPSFGKCGGCFMQQISYDDQCDVKRVYVQKLFDDSKIDIKIPMPIGSPDLWYYRNRMDFPVGFKGEIGLKQAGFWREVLDLETCFLLSKEATRIMEEVRQWMKFYELEGWDAAKHKGFIRYVVIREGKNTDERMIILVTTSDKHVILNNTEMIKEELWSDLICRLKPFCSSFYRGINDRITDISESDQFVLLYGLPMLREIVNGFEFLISPTSFFQTNTKAAELLQKYVLQTINTNLTNRARILDLYCGVGFFTLPLAKAGYEVFGVELVKSAIEIARDNAQRNKIKVKFYAGKAEDHVKGLEKNIYDVIIIDPPRSGLHPKVIKKIIEIASNEIIYVSCNPSVLVTELSQFLQYYKIESVALFDMFPHTSHIEVVVRLTKTIC